MPTVADLAQALALMTSRPVLLGDRIGASRIGLVTQKFAGMPEDMTPAPYDDARAIAIRARAALSEMFADLDAVLTFSAPGSAPQGLASTGDPRFNRLWTLLGTPCVNVPALMADGGLPVGVQVIADCGDDAEALGVARFLEAALEL